MNPILQAMNQAKNPVSNLAEIKNMMNTLKQSKNPNALLAAMVNQNPALKQTMDFVKTYGGDPKKAFYKMAKEKGVNPEEILALLR